MIQKQRRQLSLVKDLVVRDFHSRYRGTLLGIIWSFFNPALMLTVYTIVFSVAFKARWPGLEDNKMGFAVIVFPGMIVHGFFAECLTRAPHLISQHLAYVKKVVFPLEILPLMVVISSGLHLTISFGILICFCIFIDYPLHFGMFLTPIFLLPLCLFTLGMTWFLSSLGVFFKDLAQFVGLLSTVSLFLAPVFFSLDSIPEEFRSYLDWNPITMPVLEIREAMFFGGELNWKLWAKWLGLGSICSTLGYFWFQNTRKGFADVL